MVRGKLVAVVALTALCLAGAAPAQALTVHVRLYGGAVRSESGAAGAPVQARLWDSGGRMKAWLTSTADGTGDSSMYLPPGVFLMPGDTLQFWEGPFSYDLGPLPRIDLTLVAPGADVVAGRIRPRIASVMVHAEGDRLTATGHDTFDVTASVTPAPDGRFRADLTALGDLQRLDEVYAGYLQGIFAVYAHAIAPGLIVFAETNYAILGGKFGSSHEVRLETRSGRVRARTKTHIGELFRGEGIVEFHRGSGAPVLIRGGDRIVVSGPWGFTDVIDPLTLEVDIANDTFAVQTRPGAVVELTHEGVALIRTADASGAILLDWAVAAGRDVQLFDRCEAFSRDRQGNAVQVVKQAIVP